MHGHGRVGDLLRQVCRWEASWCRTVSSFSGLIGALQQLSRDACFKDSESVQCARRRYGSSISGRPCTCLIMGLQLS